jgi:hypothetical protein
MSMATYRMSNLDPVSYPLLVHGLERLKTVRERVSECVAKNWVM